MGDFKTKFPHSPSASAGPLRPGAARSGRPRHHAAPQLAAGDEAAVAAALQIPHLKHDQLVTSASPERALASVPLWANPWDKPTYPRSLGRADHDHLVAATRPKPRSLGRYNPIIRPIALPVVESRFLWTVRSEEEAERAQKGAQPCFKARALPPRFATARIFKQGNFE